MITKNKIRKFFPAFLLSVSLIMISSVRIEAAPGDFDSTFGTNGVAGFALSGQFRMCCLRPQADGKLLVAWLDNSGGGHLLKLRRHHASGALDTAFGSNGEAVRQLTPSPSFVSGAPTRLSIQPDGKIIVTGYKRYFDHGGGEYHRAAAWRFTPEGLADTTFSGDGETVFSEAIAVAGSYAYDAAVSSSGKIYLTYVNYLSGAGESVLARLNADGSLDTAFGSSGKVKRSNFRGTQLELSTARTGGALYWGGVIDAETQKFVLYRYFSSGSPDTGYGFFGVAYPAGDCTGYSSASNLSVRSLELLSTGKIIFSGRIEGSYPPYQSIISRLNATGAHDSTFGNDGIIGCGTVGYFHTAKSQSDGKVVRIDEVPGAGGFLRLLETGQTDLSFAPAADNLWDVDLIVQSGDGKIVVLSGNDYYADTYYLSRYLP